MCCHTEMPCRRHRTRHPTPSQYTDTGPTCRCAIHRCGTSHWNTQLPILMSWVRPIQEILPHTPASAQLYDTDMVVVRRKLCIKFHTIQGLNPGPVVCASITLYACRQLLPLGNIRQPLSLVTQNVMGWGVMCMRNGMSVW